MKIRKNIVTYGTAILMATALSGCGTVHSPSSASDANAGGGGAASGSTALNREANVAYAGSLELVNNQFLGPQFSKQTGIHYEGRGGGAFGMAHLIASGEIHPNVFESIGTAPLTKMGTKVPKWAIGFASSPLVVAYSPSSPYAAEFRQIAEGHKPLRDLFMLMEKPGFHLGRTNPNTDPQGQSFVLMVKLAQRQLHLPSGTAAKILGQVDNSSQIYSEEGILSRLQAGQLDATSAYLPEAIQHHLPYISLPSSMNMGNPEDASTYASVQMRLSNGSTVHGQPIEVYVTTVPGAEDENAGTRFVSFLLSDKGRSIFVKNGFQWTKFIVWKSKSAIPSALQKEIAG
ncbi:extracellular solute-binding protein [Alicyclobacillus sp. SP_1]|uniref:extracellular solute-binding protein n=1 Tax=Alicyclobacillus sp. SP_1 TaxID=2942475 RepID=UPI0021575F65|nr:extracellular solute-binding protein [Alicyclobacillus sp. SP_1]